MRAGLVRSAPVKAIGAALMFAATIAFVSGGLVASAQTPDDPGAQPTPTVEEFTSAASIVARVQFNSPTDVEFLSGVVSKAPPPARIGGPPLIEVEVLDVDGGLLEEFNDWHPLWVEQEGDDGEYEMIVKESGEGRFVFGFAPDIGTVRITDIPLDQELIVIDARQIVLDYCAASPSDPGCASVPGPGQLPDTGGTSSDDGPNSLFMAAIAGAFILAATFGAGGLAYQRRRSR